MDDKGKNINASSGQKRRFGDSNAASDSGSASLSTDHLLDTCKKQLGHNGRPHQQSSKYEIVFPPDLENPPGTSVNSKLNNIAHRVNLFLPQNAVSVPKPPVPDNFVNNNAAAQSAGFQRLFHHVDNINIAAGHYSGTLPHVPYYDDDQQQLVTGTPSTLYPSHQPAGYYAPASNDLLASGTAGALDPSHHQAAADYYAPASNDLLARGTAGVLDPSHHQAAADYYAAASNDLLASGTAGVLDPSHHQAAADYYAPASNDLLASGTTGALDPSHHQPVAATGALYPSHQPAHYYAPARNVYPFNNEAHINAPLPFKYNPK